jgi:predicted Holliday junction resolvase-like endonuclease
MVLAVIVIVILCIAVIVLGIRVLRNSRRGSTAETVTLAIDPRRENELIRQNEALEELIASKDSENRAQLARISNDYESRHVQLIRDSENAVATSRARLEADHNILRQQLRADFEATKRAESKKTAARSRTLLLSAIAENLAPMLGSFPYDPKEVRHVGEIFDYLVFDGIETGEINSVVFLEVKNSKSGRVTNPRERMVRDAVNAGRVRYEVYTPDLGRSLPELGEGTSTEHHGDAITDGNDEANSEGNG